MVYIYFAGCKWNAIQPVKAQMHRLCVNRPKENVTEVYIVESVLVLQQFKSFKGRKKNRTFKAQISLPSLSPAEFTRALNVRKSV